MNGNMGKSGGESHEMTAPAEDQEARCLQKLRTCPLARLVAAFAEENEPQKPSRRKKPSESAAPKVKVDKNAGRRFKQCSVDGCIRYQRSKGLCKAHGGGRRCSAESCPRSDQGGGFCIRHGGGVRCSVDGCKNGAQRHGVCKAHGGGSKVSMPKKKIWRAMMTTVDSSTSKNEKLREVDVSPKTAATNEFDGEKESGGVTKTAVHAVQTDAMECKACESATVDKVPGPLDACETAFRADPSTKAVRPSVNNFQPLCFVPTQYPVIQFVPTTSPHATPSSPKAESVSPLAKACATPTRWPPHASPGLSNRSSTKATVPAPPSDDIPSSSVSVAALLLSLQTGASAE